MNTKEAHAFLDDLLDAANDLIRHGGDVYDLTEVFAATYRGLSADEKEVMNRVLNQRLLSRKARKRDDAIHFVHHLAMTSALPTLRRLRRRLRLRPWAIDDWDMVNEVIKSIEEKAGKDNANA